MSGRTITISVVVLVVVACLVVALGALAYWYFMVPTVEAVVEPTVLIDSPSHGDEVVIGTAVQVFATGQDPGKIARMELWVDGELIQSQASALPGGTSPFPIMAFWMPDTPGNHTIVVRAFNMADASGQASISVTAVEGPEVPEGCPGVEVFEHEVQLGETVEGIAAGYELTVDEVLACNPGLDPAAMPDPGTVLLIPSTAVPEGDGPPDDWLPPEDPEEAPDLPEDLEELPGEDLPPAEDEPEPGEEAPPEVEEPPEGPEITESPEAVLPTVTLGFEALEFEVDQPYDEIYCLAQLADFPMERIPETGSFNPVGGNYWDIQAELAGMNSKQITIQGDVVRVEVECFGWVGIDGWSLGHFVREHGDAEWTGDPIEVTAIADDGRWFRIVYRICPDFPCEPRPVPPAPEMLAHNTLCFCALFGGSCPPCDLANFMTWGWTGDEAEIDGFRLYRNDTMTIENSNPAHRAMFIPTSFVEPPCGETWDYTLTAYEGFPGVGLESDPSNAVTKVGPPCTTSVQVTFENLYTWCVHPDLCFDPTCLTCKLGSWIGVIAANDQYYNRLVPVGAPDIESYTVHPVSDLFFGNDTVTVELDPGENLTIGMVIVDWDGGWPGGHPDGVTLGRLKTIDYADVATGDYFMTVQSMVPGVGFGFLEVHVEVLP